MTSTPNGNDNRDFLPGFPPFARELAGTLAVHSQYVLHGNIRDRYLMPGDEVAQTITLLPMLWYALRPAGYRCLIVSDQVDGIWVYPDEPDSREAARQLLGRNVIGRKPTLERLRSALARVAGVPEPPPIDGATVQQEEADVQPAQEDGRPRAAFVLDYASRIASTPSSLDPMERAFFLFCQKLAFTAQTRLGGPPERSFPLFNPVIWLVEGERDLPSWLTAGVERIRTIAVPKPNLEERTIAAGVFAGIITAAPPSESDEPHLKTFADQTDDMTLHAMCEIARLAVDRGLPLDRIADAVRIYKLGIEDNPWRKESVRVQIAKGEREIQERVIGQPEAITRTLDILKRAALGLSGAHATSTGTRPRGTLFFAGPTGVGKTELAKRVAAILFGDQNAYLRFDMSEFSANHSADRLTGAPPGYVGFEAGGELTGAVRRKPFQVVLFDEIEKAHPQVLDKFLQILEDGRLTDGQGTTTYFSECVLIFTSNLGIIRTDKQTGEKIQLVEPPIEYRELEAKVRAAVSDHFTYEMGRPELLNRLGDNIVVFNFIDAKTAALILAGQIRNVQHALVREQQITLELGPEAEAKLLAACTEDLRHGGRGIGNQLESRLINPLARFIFDENCPPGSAIHIKDLSVASSVAMIEASRVR